MDKFLNKYRIPSHRKPNWDYSSHALYFITLVTQNRECNLGKVVNGKMCLSDFGVIVNQQWLKSFELRRELFLDEFIVMPNHLHGLVGLGGGHGGTDARPCVSVAAPSAPPPDTDARPCVSTPPPNPNFIRKPKSISSFIAGFKSAVNSGIDDYIDQHGLDIPKYNRNNHFFQPNYHDHIVRNDQEYQRIKNYIILNPAKWNRDTFNPDGNIPAGSI